MSKQKKSLFDIGADFLALANEIEESGGDLTPELEEKLIINDEEFEHKVSNYIAVIREYEGKLDTAIKELKRVKDYKDRVSNTINRLKDALDNALSIRDISELELGTNKLSYRKSKKLYISDDINDVDIPQKFLKKSVSIDKAGLKKALLSNEVEPNDHYYVVENKNLQIR